MIAAASGDGGRGGRRDYYGNTVDVVGRRRLRRGRDMVDVDNKVGYDNGGSGSGLFAVVDNNDAVPTTTRQMQSTDGSGSIFIESLIFFALMMAFSVFIWVICRYR